MKAAKLEFESPLPHKFNTLKAATNAAFMINTKNFVNTLPAIYHYRKPEIKRTGEAIYIEYYYRVPIHMKELYDNKTWLRFRIREDINRRKEGKEQYAEFLRNEIEQQLRHGFNPFNTGPEQKFIESETVETEKELNATDALQVFIEAWRKRGLDTVSTLPRYERIVDRLTEWLKLKKIPYISIKEITQNHIEHFLNDMKKKYGFGNREYNNHFDFTRTVFNYLLKKKLITESPCADIDKMKANTTKHRYYDKKSLADITKVLKLKDPYTLIAFQTVYYLCVRSEKEIKNLKVGNINWEQNKVLAEIGKGKKERYIPLDENIKEIFLQHGIDKFPDQYYIFGIEGKPSAKPFGSGFFAKRFRKIRDAAGLSKDFTIYGAKHTRVVHLKSDNVPDADIMSLTGHSDFGAYTKYLRDLGLTSDIKNINAKSRKI